MTEQTLDLGRAIRLSEAAYRDRARFDAQAVFWGSVYGVGLVGLGWLAVKLGVMVADAQAAVQGVTDQIRIKELEARAVWLEAQIKLKLPGVQSLPWWMVLLGPVPSIIASWLATPDDDPEVDALKQELLDVYAELEDLRAPREAVEGAPTGVIRKLDVVYGAVGPVLPVGVVTFNCLQEYLRVRRMRMDAGLQA